VQPVPIETPKAQSGYLDAVDSNKSFTIAGQHREFVFRIVETIVGLVGVEGGVRN